MNPIERPCVFFGLTTLNSLPQRELGIALELANRAREVHYIELPSSSIGWLRQKYDEIFKRSSLDNKRTIPDLPDNFHVHVPPLVPTSLRTSITPQLDKMLFRRWFRESLLHLPWEESIVWIMLPLWWKWFVDRTFFKPRLVCYDIADNLEVFCRTKKAYEKMSYAHRLLLKDADLVLHSAPGMSEEIRSETTRPAHFLPNGLSNAFLPLAENTDFALPEKNAIGFFGFFDDRWIDMDLITRVVEQYPDNPVVLAGPMEPKYAEHFGKYRNVKLPGFLSHAEVSALLETFRVAIIPFKQNEITRVVNPLKLYEYASAGVPIVSIWTEELARYSDHVMLAETHERFVQLVGEAVTEIDRGAYLRRKQFALANTWRARIDLFEDILGNHIGPDSA